LKRADAIQCFHRTFTRFIREQINAVSILFPMRCHSIGCGTVNQTQSAMLLATQSFFGRLHDAVIRVYDEWGNVIETHEHAGDFREP
jgi:hypothetical protein